MEEERYYVQVVIIYEFPEAKTEKEAIEMAKTKFKEIGDINKMEINVEKRFPNSSAPMFY